MKSRGHDHAARARAFSDAPKRQSGNAWLNVVGEEAPDAIRAAFGGNYARLTELKKTYGPTDFFSLNQNVKPAG